MTVWPRALCGPVLGMARPRRPLAEIGAVREAASIVQGEGQVASAKAVSRQIAQRVIKLMLADLEEDDPLAISLAALEERFAPTPFRTLATSPDIDTVSDFVAMRVQRLRARSGRYLLPPAQARERDQVVAEMIYLLATRYARHLQS